jgi:hypothetical protein
MRLVKLSEASTATGLSIHVLQGLARSRVVPSHRVGGSRGWVIDLDALLGHLGANREDPAAASVRQLGETAPKD